MLDTLIGVSPFARLGTNLNYPVSAIVEDNQPDKVVVTFTNADTSLLASDFTIAGFTVSSLARDVTNKILTLSLSTQFEYGRVATLVLKGKSYSITNNVEYLTALKNAVVASNIVSYFPMNEVSGTTMVDSVNARNGEFVDVTLNQAGFIKGKSILFPGLDSAGDLYAAIAAMNKNEGAIIINVKHTQTPNVSVSYRATDINDWPSLSYNPTDKKMYFNSVYGGVGALAGFHYYGNTEWMQICITWSVSANTAKVFVNGLPADPIPSVSLAGRSWSGTLRNDLCAIGNERKSGSQNKASRGYYSHVAVINKYVTESDLRKIYPYNQVIFAGDSRTEGEIYPTKAVADSLVAFRNKAVAGISTATSITAAAVNVDAFYRADVKNICVMWCGVNDGTSAAQTYADLRTYCLARKAVGFKTIICTEIDAQDASRNSVNWNSTYMPALNVLLKADHSFADGFADLSANANLMDANNTTYFNVDKVHLTDAGYSEVAAVVKPVIASLL